MDAAALLRQQDGRVRLRQLDDALRTRNAMLCAGIALRALVSGMLVSSTCDLLSERAKLAILATNDAGEARAAPEVRLARGIVAEPPAKH